MMFSNDSIKLMEKAIESARNEKEALLAHQAKELAPPTAFRQRLREIFRPHDRQLQELINMTDTLQKSVDRLTAAVTAYLSQGSQPDVRDASAAASLDNLSVQVEAKLKQTGAPPPLTL